MIFKKRFRKFSRTAGGAIQKIRAFGYSEISVTGLSAALQVSCNYLGIVTIWTKHKQTVMRNANTTRTTTNNNKQRGTVTTPRKLYLLRRRKWTLINLLAPEFYV